MMIGGSGGYGGWRMLWSCFMENIKKICSETQIHPPHPPHPPFFFIDIYVVSKRNIIYIQMMIEDNGG
jgi:hypothetical protein